LKPGEAASRSGEYQIRGPRGFVTGEERVSTAGKALKPQKKVSQPLDRLGVVTKSGRTIIPSPAKSANTISAWSKAFKK
jgi:hypothetical protein